MGKVSPTLSGKVNIKDLSIFGENILRIPTVTFTVSPTQLLLGKIRIQTVSIDTLSLAPMEFMKAKNELPLSRMNWLRGKLTDMQISDLTVDYTQSLSGPLFTCGRIKVHNANISQNNLQVQLQAENIAFTKYPKINAVTFTLISDSNKTAINNLQIHSNDGVAKGAMAINIKASTFPFQGQLVFSKINLQPLSASGLFDKALVRGWANGQMKFNGLLTDKNSLTATGHLSVLELSLKNFPLQQHRLIDTYFSDLKDLKFDKLEIADFSFQQNHVVLSKVVGQGKQCSFIGQGNFTVKTNTPFHFVFNLAPSKNFCGLPVSWKEMKINVERNTNKLLRANIESKDLLIPNLPPINSVTCALSADTKKIALNDLQMQFAEGEVKGELILAIESIHFPFNGHLVFDKINLERFSKMVFFDQGVISGQAQGQIKLRGLLTDKSSLEVAGDLNILQMRLKDFPFQQGPAVVQFLSSLKELSFSNLSIPDFYLKKGHLVAAKIMGQGKQICIAGTGNIEVNGTHTFQLNLNVGRSKNLLGLPFSLSEMKIYVERNCDRILYSNIFIRDIVASKFPTLNTVTFKLIADSKKAAINDLQIHGADGDVKGNVVVEVKSASLPYNGQLTFSKINLDRFAARGFFNHALVKGIVQGQVKFRGILTDKNSLDAKGSLSAFNMRLKNFPFQHEQAIDKYLPSLKDLNFRLLSIPNFQWQKSRMNITQVTGQGDQLSFLGKGKISSTGTHAFHLQCRLSQKCYQSLNIIVRQGVTNAKGEPEFGFVVKGNLNDQSVILDRTIGTIVKEKIKRLGNDFLDEFDLTL